jgi:hypothetical protein
MRPKLKQNKNGWLEIAEGNKKMCIICVDLQKGLLTPFEATRNLSEMIETLDEEHVEEVLALIYMNQEEECCSSQSCEQCDPFFEA